MGTLVGSRYPRCLSSTGFSAKEVTDGEQIQASCPAAASVGEGEEELASVRLLKELTEHESHLARQEEELRQEVREAHVALRLLRLRGQTEDAPACREQSAKARTAEAALKLLREERAEAVRFEGDLRRVLEEDQTRTDHPKLDPQVWGRVRLYLAR
jgi:hypothetical protein